MTIYDERKLYLDTNLLRNDLDAVTAKLTVKNFAFDKELFFFTGR